MLGKAASAIRAYQPAPGGFDPVGLRFATMLAFCCPGAPSTAVLLWPSRRLMPMGSRTNGPHVTQPLHALVALQERRPQPDRVAEFVRERLATDLVNQQHPGIIGQGFWKALEVHPVRGVESEITLPTMR